MWVVDLIVMCYNAKLFSPVSPFFFLLSFSFTFSFMCGFSLVNSQCTGNGGKELFRFDSVFDAICEARPGRFM